MPKDAKFGLVLGVGLVILIAVLFFGKEQPRPAPRAATPAVSTRPAGPVAPTAPDGAGQPPVAVSTAAPTVYSVAAVNQR